MDENWADFLDGALTICNTEGIILYMNPVSIKQFKKDGGSALIGTNLLDCHPEPSKSRLKEMLQNEEHQTYTTEKNGVVTIFHQFPWYREGKYSGFMELSFSLPSKMEHFKRD